MIENFKNKTKIETEACHWVTEMASDDVPKKIRDAFDIWRNNSTDHWKAYLKIEQQLGALSDDKDFLATLEPLEDMTFREKMVAIKSVAGSWITQIRRNPERRFLRGGFMVGVATIIVIAGLNIDILIPRTDFITEIAEIRDVTLEDGSVVTLGAHSSINVDFTKTERQVSLENGEAFFSVAKDASRPFFVTTNGVTVKVVGTKFDIHKGVSELRVSVVEGIVEVLHSEETKLNSDKVQPIAKTVLKAGEQVVTSYEKPLNTMEVIQIARLGTWRTGRLVYLDTKLEEIIADVNRYYAGQISIGSRDIGQLRFTSSFRPNQVEEFIKALTVQFPIDIEQGSGKDIKLTKRYALKRVDL